MCGIFGYIGPNVAVEKCIEGLRKLEYRGYDSAGIAGVKEGRLLTVKSQGKLSSLIELVKKQSFDVDIAIAHTRWATHGSASDKNAHPHVDHYGRIAVVHNGIIENFQELRENLIDKGFIFVSDTDTEVIAHLISSLYTGDFVEAVRKSIPLLKGTLAIAVVHKDHPKEIVVAARENPLAVGIDYDTGEVFLSSDPNSFTTRELHVLFLHRDEVAHLSFRTIVVYNLDGVAIPKTPQLMTFDSAQVSKNGYDHFMLKEIFEQPQTVQRTMHERISEEYGTAIFPDLAISPHELQSISRILILACGTSWHAGLIAANLFENIARIPSGVEIASEFRYTNPIISAKTLVIAISQSGETADTIAALREAKSKGATVLGICNVRHSTLAREADACLFLEAGPEISVCSTKAYTSQLTLIALLTLHLARLGPMDKSEGQLFIRDLKRLPHVVTQVLNLAPQIEHVAEKYSRYEHFFFLGRRYMYPTSLEAALKLKEISYLNATGYPAGELKHGPIALVNPDLAVIGMCGNKQTFSKTISNLMEVKARGSRILAFAPQYSKELEMVADDIIYLPDMPDVLAAVPYSIATQLLAYFIARNRGTEIDQPRNLAKSVTVE